jgi:hypothetical protein
VALKTLAEKSRLAPPELRERRVELALDPALVVPGRLAVADKEEARRGRFVRYR